MKEFIILFIVSLIVLSIYKLCKQTKKIIDYNNIKIERLKNEIKSISTIEECELVKEKIIENYNKTDIIYKHIKEEYYKLYYIVIGIEETIKKLIQH